MATYVQERAALRLEVIAGAECCRVGSAAGAYLCCETCGYPFDNGDRYWALRGDDWGMYCSRACLADDAAKVERFIDLELERREDAKLDAMLREAGAL